MNGGLISRTYRWARRFAVAIIGGTVVAIGCIMIVAPGPAFVVIPAGLAILGLEFAWARRWLEKIKSAGQRALEVARARNGRVAERPDEQDPRAR